MNEIKEQKIVSFNSDDEVVMRRLFKQHNQSVASVVSVFIFAGTFAVLINGRASLHFKFIFIFFFYFPMLILFYVLYQRKLIYDLVVKKKMIESATVNIISLFGEHKDAHIQVVFRNNAFRNFKVNYDIANSLYEGQQVTIEQTYKSNHLLKIHPENLEHH